MILHHKIGVQKMILKEELLEISKNLAENEEDCTSAFRQNLFTYLASPNLTLNQLSEHSNIAYSTLNSFLYGNSNSVKIDNVVKLAKTLDISIDELVGSNTIPQLSRESLRMCREMPENDLNLVRWFIRYLYQLNSKTEPNKRYISVMLPRQTNNGDFEVTADYEKIEISEVKEPLRSKIFMGFHIICDHYMPHYGKGDVIFIANDRPPRYSEHIVVRVGKYLFITKRLIENDIPKIYSVRDGKYRIDESEIDEIIGYIAYKKTI